MKAKTKYFHTKGFVSFITLWSFLFLSVSGILLYFTPAGRIAHWVNWQLFGLTKEGWGGLHTIIALLFLISIGFHIYFNWKVLMTYFKEKARKSVRLKKELVLSLALVFAIAIGSIKEAQPIWFIMDINENIKNYWERTSGNPPIPHAEEKTLNEIARLSQQPLAVLLLRLKNKNIVLADSGATLLEIAQENKLSPDIIYSYALDPLEVNTESGEDGSSMGAGYGKMSVEELAASMEMKTEEVVEFLKENHITVTAKDIVRDVAASHKLKPVELKVLLEHSK